MNVYKIPDGVGWVEAATTEPLANSMHATNLGSPADGNNVVIFGAGIIGLGIVQSLQVIGVKLNKLIMVDVSEKRLQIAKDLGVTDVINASKEDVYQRCIDLTGEVPVIMLGGAVTSPNIDVVYDCVGYIQERPEPPVLQTAMMIAKEYGKVVVHGAFEAPVTLEMMALVGKHVQVQGSYGFVIQEDGATALEWMRDKKVDRMKIVSHEFPIEQAKEAFDIQCQVDNSIKVVIKP